MSFSNTKWPDFYEYEQCYLLIATGTAKLRSLGGGGGTKQHKKKI